MLNTYYGKQLCVCEFARAVEVLHVSFIESELKLLKRHRIFAKNVDGWQNAQRNVHLCVQ
jgi:hypothetical protein